MKKILGKILRPWNQFVQIDTGTSLTHSRVVRGTNMQTDRQTLRHTAPLCKSLAPLIRVFLDCKIHQNISQTISSQHTYLNSKVPLSQWFHSSLYNYLCITWLKPSNVWHKIYKKVAYCGTNSVIPDQLFSHICDSTYG